MGNELNATSAEKLWTNAGMLTTLIEILVPIVDQRQGVTRCMPNGDIGEPEVTGISRRIVARAGIVAN